MTLQLAFRNLFRNTRRTLVNLAMIAGGFIAVVIFEGFAADILEATKWGAVNSQFGHIQVAEKRFWHRRETDSFLDRQLKNPGEMVAKVAKIPDVKSVSSRQSLYGLISNGEQSVAAQIVGFQPEVETELLIPQGILAGELFAGMKDGPPLAPPPAGGVDTQVFQAAVGEGLANQIGIKPGQNLTIIAQTADGGMNAVDAEVRSIFRTVIQEIDDTTVYVPLPLAQKLLDADTAERIVVKVREHDLVAPVLAQIRPLLDENQDLRSWRDLARLYNQTEEYFRTQNTVVATIIFFLIFLSTVSAVSMSVTERTGEIGTLRAIGRTREEVMRLFATEGLLMGLIGSAIGVVLGRVASFAINQAAIPMVIPGATQDIPIHIQFVGNAYWMAFAATVVASAVASTFSARRAVRLKIVDCLKYNI